MKWLCEVENFFKLCILREILGKIYTRRPVLNNIANQANYVQQTEPVIKDQGHKAKTYCYCKKYNVGTTMTACDNVIRETEWFHVNCLQLEHIPKGKWYCPDCQKCNHKTVLVNMKNYIFILECLSWLLLQYIYIYIYIN